MDLVQSIGRSPLTILDIGGLDTFWEVMDFTSTPHRIILLNRFRVPTKYENFTSVVGDARNLSDFPDKSIDIVFSNSVIEHLETFENQRLMANEIRRVGRTYFVQTPSFSFPIEPHFICPFFHWLPFSTRVAIIQHFSLGYIDRQPTRHLATETVKEFRIIKLREFTALFPDAAMHYEKVMGLTKSYIALKQ